MADIDIKGIGFAVKDIVFGVATAAAGAVGGQAGAAGVAKAGDGIDKVVAMATGEDSRAHRFDRADYAARPVNPAVRPATPAPAAPTDKEEAVAHLASLGWSPAEAAQILAGPSQGGMAQIALTEATALSDAQASAEAKPVRIVDGRRLPTKSPA